MGACFSTTKDSSSSSDSSLSPASRSKRRKSSKSAAFARRRPAGQPVPEPEAEETVKEVLSETPKPRPPPKPRDDGAATAAAAYVDKKLKQQQQQQQQRGLLAFDKGFSGLLVAVDDGFCPNFDDRSEDASEAFSESLSASTTTVTEKQDPGEVEKVRRRNDRSPAPAPVPPRYQKKRSVSGEFGCRRESSVAVRCGSGRSAQQSPARRTAEAPGPAVARTNSAREMGHAARSRVTSGARREPGERSGRRSVSPAAKRVVEARHNATALAAVHSGTQYRSAPVPRTNGRVSPRRLPPPAEEPAKQREEEEGREAVAGSREEGFGEGNESLDNPLVSLECFIFL